MIYLYLLATLLFVFGIKRLTHVKTCQQGNRLSEVGMLVAVITVLLLGTHVNWGVVVAGILVGGGVGLVIAKRTPTTQMPEMVAALNGFGGVASALVAMAELLISPRLKEDGVALGDLGVVEAVAFPATIIV
ncbi:MAG: NAD(P)(+) transhydrogenase (Re/Si-specific) subunit beta, partial [Planctomycetes bacterium]|nr:NAD(P)(+) transhydrogenase (Re/Si-specific) subunit beta [Planctomycetota bacterium]